MTRKVAFLWPEADFRATGLAPPPGYELYFGQAAVRAEAEAACAGAAFIITASGFGRVDTALLDLAPTTRLVQLTGAGFDNVDRAACAARGIPVAYLPGLNAPSVAQLIVQLAFRLRRPLPVLSTGGAAAWAAGRRANVAGQELEGQVGVVGFGNIGRDTARLFRGLGLEVVRAAHRDQQDDVVAAMDLDRLCETSDIVAVCLPLTAKTKGLIDARHIGLMKKDAILINAGRGGIVDEQAVADALSAGQLAGAGFDVFADEPLSAYHPFLSLSDAARGRVILTPHIGGQTRQSKTRNFRISLENVERVANGDPPLYELAPPR